MSSGKTLTAEMLADALGCFWNAAIGDARDKQDSRVLAVASSMAEGFAAIESRLREQAEPAITSAVDGEVLKALRKAEQFIANGIELGFIRMPDANTPDSAHDTLPLIRAALSQAQAVPASMGAAGEIVVWAVGRWNAEVKDRPLVNVHRRSLDDSWRQVIRHFGGNAKELCGPAHDELVALAGNPSGGEKSS
ncbi:hypothetical protein NKI25_18530 [Mesorhizobium sp. M0808]|uniref:hypothetical protein n=1 Tax=Mesorhizobium sp. M0808 TaxID=2957002 RepID=UPI00333AFB32